MGENRATNTRNILLLRSADMKTCCLAIEHILDLFPKARLTLLVQPSTIEFFRNKAWDITLIEYPYRDFNMAVPYDYKKKIPAMDLALSLYKNEGGGYEEVDAFLQNYVRSKNYGFVTGNMTLSYSNPSFFTKRKKRIMSLLSLYGYGGSAMLRCFFFNRRHCTDFNKVILKKKDRIIIDFGGSFKISPNSICRMGYVPSDWKRMHGDAGTIIRIQKGAVMEFEGNVNLFSGVRINVFPNARVKIGDGSYIAFNSRIFSETEITIGKNCAISWDVEIMDTDFHRMDFRDENNQRTGLFINDHVWIGAGSRILRGVELGSNVVVGADSVVTRSFPDNSIIAGNPARIVGTKEGKYRV